MLQAVLLYSISCMQLTWCHQQGSVMPSMAQQKVIAEINTFLVPQAQVANNSLTG